MTLEQQLQKAAFYFTESMGMVRMDTVDWDDKLFFVSDENDGEEFVVYFDEVDFGAGDKFFEIKEIV